MEKIVVFQLEEREIEKLKKIAAQLRCKLIFTEKTDYNQLLGDIIENRKSPLCKPYQGDGVKESMVVLSGFEDKKLEKLLLAMKKQQLQVDYKAVATAANLRWTILKIYFEMEKERNIYRKL